MLSLSSRTFQLLAGAALVFAETLAVAKEPPAFPKEFSLLPHRDVAGVCSSSLTSLIKGILASTSFSEKDRNTLAANAAAARYVWDQEGLNAGMTVEDARRIRDMLSNQPARQGVRSYCLETGIEKFRLLTPSQKTQALEEVGKMLERLSAMEEQSR